MNLLYEKYMNQRRYENEQDKRNDKRKARIKKYIPGMGTWLVEDIENEMVPPGNVAMWWLGCTESGLRHRKTNVCSGSVVRQWERPWGGKMKVKHRMANMCGGTGAAQPSQCPLLLIHLRSNRSMKCLRPIIMDHMSAEWAARHPERDDDYG